MDYLYVSLLWIGYCILHSFLISITFMQYLTKLLGRYYAFYRVFYVIISLYLLIILINYSDQFKSPIVISFTFPWSIVRNILLLLSLVIFFWAFFFSYDPLSFFGIRQILNMRKKNVQTYHIRKNGLLAYSRHPMYFALIIFLLITAFTLMDIIINLILIIYVLTGTILEEKKLILEFGEEYIQYKQEVPMLFPFTKRNKGFTLHPK